MEIYPNKKNCYESELKSLNKAKISQEDKDLIIKFHDYLFSTGSGNLRVSKLSSQLRLVCEKITLTFDSMTKEEMIKLIALYNRDPNYSDATKADYRRGIKQFYKWFKDEDKRLESEDKTERIKINKFYKFVEKEIKIGYKHKQTDPLTVITDEDCKAIVQKGCKTPRDKAFISMLHESGCRAGEFLNIKVGDVVVQENYMELDVDGKTGKRKIFLVKSLPYFIKYLDVHQTKQKTDYLWLSEAQHNSGNPMFHKGAQKLIDRSVERSNVIKKHNFHWFRHSRATILSPKMSETILCKYMGWTIGSRQIRTYCHLSVKQVEDIVLSINGIKKKEDDEEKPVECVCGTLNNPEDRYCFRCFKPLSQEVIIQDKELVNNEINKTVKFMMEMTKNPEMMKRFEEFKTKQKKTEIN